MNVKKAIRKILALGTGATIMGATILGATAADLANFPAPFVQDGAYNAQIVVGEGAQVPDVVGAIDIATRLQYEMKQVASETGGAATTVTVSGDAERVQTTTDILEIGEDLNGVREVFSESQLDALASGTFRNNKGSFSYDQRIDLSSSTLKVDYVEDDDRNEAGDYLYVENDAHIYTYEVNFPTALKTAEDSGDLTDLTDKSISLMGRNYAITTATVDDAGDVKLELMGGDISDTLFELESKTYTLNGKDYEVTVSFIGSSGDDTVVKFSVVYDGQTEVTSSIASGESYMLEDGVEIGVRDALEQNDPSGVMKDFTEFYMGANKVILENGESLEVGADSLRDATVTIDSTGVKDDEEVTISKISISVIAPDDLYVPADGMLSEELESDEKGLLFAENFDFKYAGLTAPSTETVKFSTSDSDRQVNIEFTNREGSEYTLPVFYSNSVAGQTSDGWLGDKDGQLYTVEMNASTTGGDDFGALSGADTDVKLDEFNFTIEQDDMFVLYDNSKDDYKRYTYVFEYNDYDDSDDILTLVELGSGDSFLVDLTTVDAGDYVEGDLSVGGKEYKVFLNNGTGTNPIWVDMDGDGLGENVSEQMSLTTSNGLVVTLPRTFSTTSTFNLSVDSSYLDEEGVESFLVSVEDKEDEVNIGDVSGLLEVGDSEVYAGYLTRYGIWVEQDRDTQPNEVEISMPATQLEAQVFLTSGAIQTTETEAESAGSTYTIAPIAVGAAQLDSEVSNWQSKNVIIVGGPCANTVAAEFLGNPEPCGTGFEAGKAKVMLKEYGSNVAMLVAGYDADDTRRATRVVNNYRNYPGFTGSEIVVEGTSMSDITVRTPSN